MSDFETAVNDSAIPAYVFGPRHEVTLFNPEALRGGLTGIAFDFNLTLTVIDYSGGPAREVIRPAMAAMVRELRDQGIRLRILTGAESKAVYDLLCSLGYPDLFSREEIASMRDTAYRDAVPHDLLWRHTKLPTLIGCNLLIDDSLQLTRQNEPAQYGYTAIEMFGLQAGQEGYVRDAFVALGIL
ncbi:hypothetical protein M1555_05480 [Patescibacteria group bacterium]|nr:hypothetical protein [Patescibacteria group bacterium]